MEANKVVITLSIIAILILILVPTITKVSDNHLDKSYLVVTKKIKEQAENCYYEKKCLDTKITLKELKEKGYIGDLINPKTETYFDLNSYVIVDISSDIIDLHLF